MNTQHTGSTTTMVEPATGNTTSPTENDTATMTRMGKTQRLHRSFTFWTLLGLTASMLCSWEAVFFANSTAMLNGGPPTLIYSFLYAWSGALATAASLAELASIYPTSGGQYHWTAKLAPKSCAVFLSWFTGWIATLGWMANVAAGAFFAATMVQGVLVSSESGFEPHRWQGSALILAVMVVVFVVNSVGSRLLSLIEGAVLLLHLAGFLAVVVPILYFSRKGDSKDVWRTFSDGAGWNSDGLEWFIGLISSNLPLIGFDGPVHLAEECVNAPLVVPRTMVATVLLNGALGWAVAIAFSYCALPTLDQALSSPTGYDFIEVFHAAVGKTGAVALTAVLILLIWLATFGFLASASRQTWAFARDNGLPFSAFLAHVNETVALPLRAIVLCAVIPCLLGLINIGSTAAFNAIVSLTEAGLFVSYLIPIVLFMKMKMWGDNIEYGPWKMGRGGIVVNAFSVVFLVISIFFSFFPPALPVTLVSMNWSAPVFLGFLISGLVWYVFVGRERYVGPIVERTSVHEVEMRSSDA